MTEYNKILNEKTDNFLEKDVKEWENIYLSNKEISKEMEYILQRKKMNIK